MEHRRQWEGTEWQEFALRLAQLRHGGENVQVVPDKVRGDAGIEFFSMNGCVYQCYAPEESSDVSKAASAMKAKAQRDLRKLSKNQTVVSRLLQGIKIRRWILLCPFLDNKDVVASVRESGSKLHESGLSFLSADFEALVQSQQDFSKEIERLRQLSISAPVNASSPSPDEVKDASKGLLGERLVGKLARAFPAEPGAERQRRAHAFIRSLLTRDNTLESLRIEHPILWERFSSCISAEEDRLSALGGKTSHPADQLEESLQRIERSLRHDLRDIFGIGMITTMSTGTVADWLVRCPLDFDHEPDGYEV